MSGLPSGWVKTTLGAVAPLFAGSTPKGVLTASPGSIPFFKVGDMNSSQGRLMADARVTVDEAEASTLRLKVFPAGSVIFPKVGGALHTNKKRVLTRDSAIDTNTMASVPTAAIDDTFLYHWLTTITLSDFAYGSPIPQVSRSRLADAVLWLPPLSEQKRIVAVIEMQLSRLDAGTTALASAKRRLHRLRDVGTLGLIEGSGTKVRLGDVSEVRLGRQRSPKNHTGSNMIPYLRAANVTWEGLDLSDVKSMHFSETEVSTFRLQPGDVLISEASGSASEVGKPAIWNGSISDCCFQNTLLRIRSDQLSPEYIYFVMLALARSGTFARASRGVGIHHLGKAGLENVMIEVPDLATQNELVRVMARQERTYADLEDLTETQLTRAERLRHSILSLGFSGQLVDQDPSEEPASVLLERIPTESPTGPGAIRKRTVRTSRGKAAL